jgi:chemotaxis regulatin CheY-phosphate phosphatase CheZ
VKREAERTLPALEACDVVNRKMIYEIKGTVSKFKACMNDISEIDIKNFEKQQLEMLASGIYSNLELMNKMQEIMHSKDLVFKNASLLEEVYAIVLSTENIAKNFKALEMHDDIISSLDDLHGSLMRFKIIQKEFDSEISPDIKI